MPSVRVALAGATGNLGTCILQALLDADILVTILSRFGGNSSILAPHSNLTVKEVDFSSADSIAPALHGVEVVISCLATSAIGSQNPLIDAACASGVKKFIPAEFGMDSANPLCAELPVCAPKVATQRYLLEKSALNPGFNFTAVVNGLFLDWGLKMGLILNLVEHTATLYNGGDVPFSTTNLVDVAAAVLGIIRNPAETANRTVYVHSAVVTQNQLIRYAKEHDGKEWVATVKSTEDLWKECLAELAKGPLADVDAAMLGFCFCGTMNPDYGCDYSGHLDNELLDIHQQNEADLRRLVSSLM
ncbi:hypothetical protein BX600DRAFT_483732 [Xylariales sp. PMI_506]|nr:hypothetical protein BX600DRAFT_483732 [Xylariales sp. PMI_506]